MSATLIYTQHPRAHILQDSGRMTMEAMDLEEVEDDEDDE